MIEYSASDCTICGAEGTVTEYTRQNDSEYKNGYFKGLLIDYSKCSACGSEFATPEQINRNAWRARERMEEVTQKALERNSVFNKPEYRGTKPIHVWIDEWALESLRERDRAITLRKKLYGKPTRKGNKWKRKILSGY
jgi:hypothetical protein